MKTVAIIPARGGSKGIPRKNLKALNGLPLLDYTVHAARTSVNFVYVSTEDPEVADHARDIGVGVIHRPPLLAEDSVHSIHVILHAIKHLDLHKDTGVAMLFPTSPLRTAVDISRGFDLLESSESVVGVMEVGPCNSARTIHGLDSILQPLSGVREHLHVQRQEADRLYMVNGALFIARVGTLLKHKTFHIEDAIGFLMSKMNSIDINTLEDWSLAEKLVRT